MNLKDQLDALLDSTAFDSTGAKVGAVRQIYVDDASGKATFATVATGIFSADAIIPLHGARLLDDELHVDHTRAVIRDSPRPDNTEDALTPEQEVKLLEYYGIETPARLRGAAAPGPGTATGESASSGGEPPGAGTSPGTASEGGNKSATTSSATSSSSTDTPEPAKTSGPGPAAPAGPPSDDISAKGENSPRD